MGEYQVGGRCRQLENPKALFLSRNELYNLSEERLNLVLVLYLCDSEPSLVLLSVKGGEKVHHCGGGIVYHRHDEKGLNWEPGGIRSGAGVRSSGVSQESTGSSDTWEAALCRLCLRR